MRTIYTAELQASVAPVDTDNINLQQPAAASLTAALARFVRAAGLSASDPASTFTLDLMAAPEFSDVARQILAKRKKDVEDEEELDDEEEDEDDDLEDDEDEDEDDEEFDEDDEEFEEEFEDDELDDDDDDIFYDDDEDE